MKEVSTDLFHPDHKIIVHGVNCRGIMGSGVAKQFKAKYPEVYEEYRVLCETHDELPEKLLGTLHWMKVGDALLVNLFSQIFYGSDGKRYAEYGAIRLGLESLVIDLDNVFKENKDEIHIPHIGCGLGGLDWVIVKRMLLEIEDMWDNVEFVVHTL